MSKTIELQAIDDIELFNGRLHEWESLLQLPPTPREPRGESPSERLRDKMGPRS
jgi:hypothetical protein